MPFLSSILQYLPLIQTGASIVGNVLGGRAQNKAIDRAAGINQQATNDAMAIIMGLYDQGQASLSPYQNVGPSALNNLQSMANRGRVPAPASIVPTPTNSMARFAPSSAMMGGGTGSVTNAMMAGGNPQQQAASSGAKNAMLGGLGGAAGTMGLGMASGAMLGAPLSFGAGLGLSALGGPIGLGLGLAGSLIGSQFGKNNPYKAAASRGIDEVSRLVWGTNTPGIPPEQLTQGLVADMIRGRKPVAQGKAEINALMNEWEQGMRANGTPDSVIQSSIQTQKGYFAPLKGILARLEQQPAA